MSHLRTAVVLDYQNVHLGAADLFAPGQPRHDSLIHPLHFARRLVHTRNRNQREGYPQAELSGVYVFRGQPSAEHEPEQYRYCSESAREWESSDPRVHVTLRPLKYRYEYGADGTVVRDVNGVPVTKGRPSEKGVDVLCALEVVEQSRRGDIDLVILASRDTDLQPALDLVCETRSSRVETFAWKKTGQKFRGSLMPSQPYRIWNTNLNEEDFLAVRDQRDYRR